jgi:hypothetical protein
MIIAGYIRQHPHPMHSLLIRERIRAARAINVEISPVPHCHPFIHVIDLPSM